MQTLQEINKIQSGSDNETFLALGDRTVVNDENTGKVMFNLRCESDVPMSKMKNLSSNNKLPKQMTKSTADEDRSAASGFEDVTL